jgi:uncharacterized membrane protein
MERVFPTGDDNPDMSPPSRVVAVALLVVGVVAVASVPVTVLAQDDTTEQDDPDPFGENPDTSFSAELQADGDAQWNITTTVSLESDSDVEAYRSTAAAFEDGELPPLGYEAFETGMAEVNGQTDREMALTDPRRDTSTQQEIENGVGRFTVEFTWENFMRDADNELVIDREVLVMENGNLWLPGLSSSQTLSITAPPGYGVRDASVGTQNGRLLWEGPTSFDETSLQTRFLGSNGGTNTRGLTDRSGVFPWILLPIIAVGVAVAVLLTRREQIQIDLPADFDLTAGLPTGATGGTTEQEGDPDDIDSADEVPAEESDGVEEIDTELLSDEERVERLLSSNGGRMKQADIVKETDWSNAKVSQLLSSMEEEGRIDKLRIGRENLISFPDENITDPKE